LDSAWLLVQNSTQGIFKEDVDALDGSGAILVFAEREEIAWQLVASSPFCCEPDKDEQHGWYYVTAALLMELRESVPALCQSQQRSALVLESSELPTVLVDLVRAYTWPVAAVPLRWPAMHVLAREDVPRDVQQCAGPQVPSEPVQAAERQPVQEAIDYDMRVASGSLLVEVVAN
jgi:hypothetical protein